MRVLMLGWEYPPHISGGLGTACEGLTRALAEEGIEILFLVPRLYGDENAPHMKLLAPSRPVPAAVARPPAPRAARPRPGSPPIEPAPDVLEETVHEVEREEVERIPRAYESPIEYRRRIQELHRTGRLRPGDGVVPGEAADPEGPPPDESFFLPGEAEAAPGGEHYDIDLLAQVDRYARSVERLARSLDVDLIHGHDWMTFPAALAARAATGRPTLVHVHSLEFDRSGEHVDPRIDAIERFGVGEADHVIAVSYYTRSIVMRSHGVPGERISVVHNGVKRAEGIERYHLDVERGPDRERIVLFLGRITFQKGPDYFVRAAAKVVPHFPNVRFVMAGRGDMLGPMKDLVARLGLTSRFDFPGFLQGPDLERYLTIADLYVMPSVSEPFGITPLEAMAYDTPVIISRQSGVSEVLRHAFKVDFWDTDRMASRILAVLGHEVLSVEMRAKAQIEIRRLHWQAAAVKVRQVYSALLAT